MAMLMTMQLGTTVEDRDGNYWFGPVAQWQLKIPERMTPASFVEVTRDWVIKAKRQARYQLAKMNTQVDEGVFIDEDAWPDLFIMGVCRDDRLFYQDIIRSIWKEV